MTTEEADQRRYRVVRNDEEQHSIWAAERELPSGWHDVGFEGTKEECLAHVNEVWTDMRPLGLRQRAAQPGA
jgi:MbtH protein